MQSCQNVGQLISYSSLLCIALQSCYNIGWMISLTSYIECTAEKSCSNSYIAGSSIYLLCSGDYACSNTIINNTLLIEGYGYYSLSNATIYATGIYPIAFDHGVSWSTTTEDNYNVEIYLYGYYAGYGAKIICQNGLNCTVYCQGNGCLNTDLEIMDTDSIINNSYSRFIVYCDKDNNATDCPNGNNYEYGTSTDTDNTIYTTSWPTSIPSYNYLTTGTSLPTSSPITSTTQQAVVPPSPTTRPVGVSTPMPIASTGDISSIPTSIPTKEETKDAIDTTFVIKQNETQTSTDVNVDQSENQNATIIYVNVENENKIFQSVLFWPFIFIFVFCLIFLISSVIWYKQVQHYKQQLMKYERAPGKQSYNNNNSSGNHNGINVFAIGGASTKLEMVHSNETSSPGTPMAIDSASVISGTDIFNPDFNYNDSCNNNNNNNDNYNCDNNNHDDKSGVSVGANYNERDGGLGEIPIATTRGGDPDERKGKRKTNRKRGHGNTPRGNKNKTPGGTPDDGDVTKRINNTNNGKTFGEKSVGDVLDPDGQEQEHVDVNRKELDKSNDDDVGDNGGADDDDDDDGLTTHDDIDDELMYETETKGNINAFETEGRLSGENLDENEAKNETELNQTRVDKEYDL